MSVLSPEDALALQQLANDSVGSADGVEQISPEQKEANEQRAQEAVKNLDNLEQPQKPTLEEELRKTEDTEQEQTEEVTETKDATVDDSVLKEVEAKAEEAGLQLSALEQEYLANGELSQETMKSLKDAGFTEEAVSAYIELREAKVQAQVNSLLDLAGGKEEYGKMAEWMRENLPKEELDAYNAGVETPHAKIYVENMLSKYKQAVGVKPNLTRGTQVAPSKASTAFRSEAEMVNAMSDPRYNPRSSTYDPAYRAEVIKRMSHS